MRLISLARLFAILCATLAAGFSEGLAQDIQGPNEKKVASPKGKAKGARPKGRRGEAPPACPIGVRSLRPAAQSMPELFERFGEGLAKNPATGFNTFMGELAQLEGPAVENIRVTLNEEREAGRRARTEYLANAAKRGYPVVNDPQRLRYLEDLVRKFAPRMQHRDRYPAIEITLLEASISDGQSFPGGFLAFTTELLREPDEATVAAVVAHELAHLDRGHMYGYVRRSKLAESAWSHPPNGNISFDQMFTRQAALLGLMFNPFRPEQEDEADCTAVTWLYLEGYDPKALVGFFERMHDRKNDQPDNPFFSFGRTHPFTLDRRDHVLTRLAQLQRWRPRQDLGRFADNLRQLEVRVEAPKKP